MIMMKTKYCQIFFGLLLILVCPQLMASGKVSEWKIIKRQNENSTKTDHPDVTCKIKHDTATEKLQICAVWVKGDLSKALPGASLLIEDEDSVKLLEASLEDINAVPGREGKLYMFWINRGLLEKAFVKLVTTKGLFKLKLSLGDEDQK